MKPKVMFVSNYYTTNGTFKSDRQGSLHSYVDTLFRENDINGVLLPQQVHDSNIFGEFLDSVVEEICSQLEPNRPNILAMSTYSQQAVDNIAVIASTKQYASEHNIDLVTIAGGPFFTLDKLETSDGSVANSLQTFLALSNADFAFVGGLQGMLDVHDMLDQGNMKFESGELTYEVLPEGAYKMDSNVMIGDGKSKVPNISELPYTVVKDGRMVRYDIMLSNSCVNGCGFCSNGQSFRYSMDMIEEWAKRMKSDMEDDTIVFLKLFDPNAFHPLNREFTEQALNLIYTTLGKPVLIDSYLDSAFLQDPAYLIDLRKRHIFYTGEFGMDPFTGRSSEFMGSAFMTEVDGKLKRKVRTQEDIDAEREGLKEILSLPQGKGWINVRLYNIFTPVDTPEDILNAYNQLAEWESYNSDKLEVITVSGMLSPDPGSGVIRRHTDLLSPEVFITNNSYDKWDRNAVMSRYPDSAFLKLHNIFSTLKLKENVESGGDDFY